MLSDPDRHALLGNELLLTLSAQVEEFYEAYCLQRKLRDGAHKMVKAYTANPGSREAKESLGEATKGYKECTEVRSREPLNPSITFRLGVSLRDSSEAEILFSLFL